MTGNFKFFYFFFKFLRIAFNRKCFQIKYAGPYCCFYQQKSLSEVSGTACRRKVVYILLHPNPRPLFIPESSASVTYFYQKSANQIHCYPYMHEHDQARPYPKASPSINPRDAEAFSGIWSPSTMFADARHIWLKRWGFISNLAKNKINLKY